MKIRATGSLITLSLMLAACGGGAEEADDTVAPAAEEAAVPTADPAETADAGEMAPADEADAGEESEPDDSATPEDAPTPAPTAAATPAERAPVAAATRPPMFAVCAACHSTESGENGIGPSLAGVFGARAGHVSTFNYSPAMEGSGLTWDEATLDRFLENPRQTVPGTTMAFNGVANAAQRQAIIDYLKGL